jgi:hypothetical protein
MSLEFTESHFGLDTGEEDWSITFDALVADVEDYLTEGESCYQLTLKELEDLRAIWEDHRRAAKKTAKKPVNILLPAELDRRVEKWCKVSGQKKGFVFAQALEAWLKGKE